jgi:hypothetical protein
MTLHDYDVKIKSHLVFIEAGAQMAASHARSLIARPDFTTLAQDELAEARAVLDNALAQIVAAQATYQSKKVEA